MSSKINMNNIEINSENTDILSGIRIKSVKPPVHIAFLMGVATFYHDLGRSVCEIISDLINGVLLFLGRFIGFVWVKSETFRAFVSGKFKYGAIIVFSPVLNFAAALSRMRRDVKAANREDGLKGAVPVFFSHFFAFVFGKRGAAVTAFNYAAPIISVVFLVGVISYATDINYAVRLEVNGKFVGYIENELVFAEAEKIFEQRLNFFGNATMVEMTPAFLVEKIGHTELLSANSVVNLMLEMSGVDVEYAYGITINNNFLGAVIDNTQIAVTLERLLAAHRTGARDEEVTFLQNVEIEYDFFPTFSIVDPQVIIRNITRTMQEAQYYTVEEGDSQGLISDKLDVSLLDLERLNPGFSERMLHPGERIRYSAAVPYLPVAVTRTEVYDVWVDFITEHRDDPNSFVGTTGISRAGERGIDTVTARVTLVNGIEIQRRIIERDTVTPPVSRIVETGTRPVPVGRISSETASYGNFIWPTIRSVSHVSEWGWWDGGYRGHAGIDIAAPYGTEIFAGASGTVVLAGWQGGYGNTVVIDHGNGLRTLYSHASKINVTVGQSVARGETIAFVGQTGTATGNHIHFEVIENGRSVNPKYFLDF
jgi:hypothetical protein